MDQQSRGNRDRGGGGRGGQDGHGSPAAASGRGWLGDGSRGGVRQRERRRRGARGGIWRQLASPRVAAALLLRLPVLWLCINNYLPQFDHEHKAIYHYDVDVRPEDLPKGGGVAPEVSQPDLSAVKAELFRRYAALLPALVVAYDGHRSLFSAGLLPEGDFRVAVQGGVFHVTLKLVKQLVRDACRCQGFMGNVALHLRAQDVR